MGFIAAGVVVRLTDHAPSINAKNGQYYAGVDCGQYGSGYPIYRDLPYVWSGEAAAEIVKNSQEPVRIFPVYVDDGE